MPTKARTKAELEVHAEEVAKLCVSLEEAKATQRECREALSSANGVVLDFLEKLVALGKDPDEAHGGPLFNASVRTLDKLDPSVPVPAIKKLTETETQDKIMCAGDLVAAFEEHGTGLAAWLRETYGLSEKQANTCLAAAEGVVDEIKGEAAEASA